jgi:hypothetical protein
VKAGQAFEQDALPPAHYDSRTSPRWRALPEDLVVRDLADVTLKPSDFVALRQLCRDDADFPSDISDWESLVAHASANAHDRNTYATPLLLDVSEFEAWYTRLRVMPGLDALRAFIIVKRREA